MSTSVADYVLTEECCVGTLCKVYCSQHAYLTGRTRAVKIPRVDEGDTCLYRPATVRAAFAGMCRSAAALDEAAADAPGECRFAFVDALNPEAEIPYIVREWYKLPSVHQLITDGPLSDDRAMRIIANLLSGLNAIHVRGVSHGNITPHNVFVTEQDLVRLTDPWDIRHRPAGTFCVPGWSEVSEDKRAIVWDLEAVLALAYHMLVGVPLPHLVNARLRHRLAGRLGQWVAEYLLSGFDPATLTAEIMREHLCRDARRAEQPAMTSPTEAATQTEPVEVRQPEPPKPIAETEHPATPTIVVHEEESTEPTRAPGTMRRNEADGAELVWVPGGVVTLGTEGRPDEEPVHTVTVRGFWIYRFPITQGQWSRFLREVINAGIKDPKDRRALPTTWTRRGNEYANIVASGIRWEDALAYCQHYGLRLPTEAEWEWAARGPEGRVYPWGNDWAEDRANTKETGIGETTEASQFPLGRSWCGALDMVGNVFEWCSTLYRPYPYDAADGREDLQARGLRVLRGGSALSPADHARCAFRCPPGPQTTLIGFRPVMDDIP